MKQEKPNLNFWIKLIIAVLTGIASALGVSAAMRAASLTGLLTNIM